MDVILGKLPNDGAKRDAIHVAIAPVAAAQQLYPGQHVGPMGDDGFGPLAQGNVGIVDPYLTHPVPKGERFFLCLYPQTVTGMRHHWSHPLFHDSGEGPPPEDSREFIQQLAAELGEEYETLILAGKQWAKEGHRWCLGHEGAMDISRDRWQQFWRHFERVTGMKNEEEESPFRCAC